MKIQFESDLAFQLRAIAAVTDLFAGAELCQSSFTVSTGGIGMRMAGVGNRLGLAAEDVLENLKQVQAREGLVPSERIDADSYNFTVEMETGTGKTYVYLRTMYELKKQYGFSKFIIVVPSVAIRAGVIKSLEITAEHFRSLYNEQATWIAYDSRRMGDVNSFATSPSLQVMVMTVGAINKKDVNNLYKAPEDNEDETPIRLISQVRPIIIVDEPQSVDGLLAEGGKGKSGGKGKEAIDRMKPLCTLRYSATHKNSYHPVYKLDAVQAYNQGLVKQIQVASARVEDAHNLPYVGLTTVTARKGQLPVATIEVDCATAGGGVLRQARQAGDGYDLEQLTGRQVYRGIQIGELSAVREDMYLTLRMAGGERVLRPGEVFGGLEADALHRAMIQRTIKEHLDRAKELRPMGIKVLSLFFIDHVARYRIYGEGSEPQKGALARIFEEEFARLLRRPDYAKLYEGRTLATVPAEAHNGYFSRDKRTNRDVDTSEGNDAGRSAAEDAYKLIMEEKERLLSLENPLEFIFSHSALREGWDNPNVFQICALREFGQESQRRQVLGRGLRICVNQKGERVREAGVNVLTVVANERCEDFAARLQVEIEQETGIKFQFVDVNLLAALRPQALKGEAKPLGKSRAAALLGWMQAQNFVDSKGKATEGLRKVLEEGKLVLPEEFREVQEVAVELLKRVTSKIQVRDADLPKKRPELNESVVESVAFRQLWEKIREKTTYRVQFDVEALVQACIEKMQAEPPIPESRIVFDRAGLGINEGGVQAVDKKEAVDVVRARELRPPLPDLLTDLQERTQLTRASLVRILKGSGRLADFERNPQQFIRRTAEIILQNKQASIVDGIRYVKVGEVYAQELFRTEQMKETLEERLVSSRRSPYNFVVLDSEQVERNFAKGLEDNEAVKVYSKLPRWFRIPTPLGSYCPDWAVLVEKEGIEQLYFVVETKGSINEQDRRGTENQKIYCAKRHFESLKVQDVPAAEYVVEKSFEAFTHRWDG